MPVVWRSRFRNQPGFIKGLDNFLWQWPLFDILEVTLELLLFAHTNDKSIVTTILDVESTMVNYPAQCRLDQSQVVLLDNRLDDAQSIESGISEIALAVHGAHLANRVTVATFCRYFAGLVLAGEDASSDRVVNDNVQTIATADGNQLLLNASSDCVVHALVDGRTDPVVVFAVHDNFSYLEGCVIGQTELDEFALLVGSVDSLKGLSEGDGSVGSVEVEDVDAISSQFCQTLIKRCEDAVCLVHSWFMRVALGGQGQTTVLPAGILGPGFLLASNVGASSINLVVALRLEVIESLVVVGQISLTST